MKTKLFCIMLMSASIFGYAQEDISRVAVIPFDAKGTSQVEAEVMTEMFETELVKTGGFLVIEQNQMDEILKAQAFSLSGCTDESCAIEIGKLLAAEHIIQGSLSRISDQYILNTKILDVTSGANLKAESVTADNLDDMRDYLTLIAYQFADKEPPEELGRLVLDKGDNTLLNRYYALGFVPGGGQFVTGRVGKGAAFLGTFLATAGFTGWSVWNYLSEKADYDGLGAGLDASVYNTEFTEAQQASYIMYGAIASVAVTYLLNLVDIFFFSKPDI